MQLHSCFDPRASRSPKACTQRATHSAYLRFALVVLVVSQCQCLRERFVLLQRRSRCASPHIDLGAVVQNEHVSTVQRRHSQRHLRNAHPLYDRNDAVDPEAIFVYCLLFSTVASRLCCHYMSSSCSKPSERTELGENASMLGKCKLLFSERIGDGTSTAWFCRY